MKTNISILYLVCIVITISCNNEEINPNEENYGYENWPGKNGIVKTNIEIPDQFFSDIDMSLRNGSSPTYIRFEVALNENDPIKNGYLHIQCFPSVSEAQLAMVEYLNVITDLPKPPRLTNEDYFAGDVAFGKEFDNKLKMCFTRNNIFAIIYASTEKVIEISYHIDLAIQNAPQWVDGTEEPSLIFYE